MHIQKYDGLENCPRLQPPVKSCTAWSSGVSYLRGRQEGRKEGRKEIRKGYFKERRKEISHTTTTRNNGRREVRKGEMKEGRKEGMYKGTNK